MKRDAGRDEELLKFDFDLGITNIKYERNTFHV